jgi:hypothetical protein
MVSRIAPSVLNSDGTYEIQLPPGDYRVSVSSPPRASANPDPTDDTPPLPGKGALPPRYTQIEKSGLTLNVMLQQAPLTWEFDLK